ncbi:MAG: MFS transporter [Deltaproteobacteria bacterium]|nr:MFS transporter [Deltaproteobacteria bacterium]
MLFFGLTGLRCIREHHPSAHRPWDPGPGRGHARGILRGHCPADDAQGKDRRDHRPHDHGHEPGEHRWPAPGRVPGPASVLALGLCHQSAHLPAGRPAPGAHSPNKRRKRGSSGRVLQESESDRGGSEYGLFASLPLTFSQAGRDGWTAGPVRLLAGVFVLAAILFVLQQQRTSSPLIRMSVLADRRVGLIVGIKVLGLMALNAVMLIYPFFMVHRLGLSVSGTGLMMLACAVSMALLTPVSGKMTDRFGSTRVLGGGGFALLVTAAITLAWAPAAGQAATFVSLALYGVSFAGLTIASTVYLLKLAPKGEEGVFSALNSLLMPVSGSLGLAVFSYVYSVRAVGPTPTEASLAGFRASMIGIMVCAVLLVAVVRLMKSKGRKQTGNASAEVIGQEGKHA